MTNWKSIDNEIFKIKCRYCSKCVYFDKDKEECTLKKIYKRCFKKNERVIDEN